MDKEINNRIKEAAARITGNYMVNKDEEAFRKELQEAWEKQPEELFLAGEHNLTRLTRDEYYQELILEVDKGVNLYGRTILRDEIQKRNEKEGAKKILTPEEVKLQNLRKRLDAIKKDWERPHGKYDTGFAHTALRLIANVQKVITEAFQVLKDNLDRAAEKKDMEPFYDLIKDAYKDKGRMLAEAVAKGEIDKKKAKNLFIKDMAFIRAQKSPVRSEIQEVYAKSLTEAMKGQNIPIQAKNTILEIVMEYQKGNYDKQILEYAKKGFSWETKKNGKNQETRQERGKQEKETGQNQKQDKQEHKEEAPQKDIKEEGTLRWRFPGAAYAMDAVEAGRNIDVNSYKKSEDAMKAFEDNLSAFRNKHPDLSEKEMGFYTRVAVSALMAQKEPGNRIWKGIEKQMSQYDSKGFRSTSATSRAAVLLDAAGVINTAAKAEAREQYTDAKNMVNEYAKKTIKDALDGITDHEQQQNFISGIADQVSKPSAQYLLSMDAREFGFRARIHGERGAEAKMRHMADTVAKMCTDTGGALSSEMETNLREHLEESFIIFCDRMPESLGGAQAAYGMVKERLGNSVLAFGKLESAREAYNTMNEKHGFEKIISIEMANAGREKEIAGQEKATPGRDDAFAGEAVHPEMFDEPKTDYEAWDNVLREADDWLER